jgi:excinuclease ABC subunit C
VIGMAKARTQGEFHDQEVVASEERFFIPGRQNPLTFPTNAEAFHILVGIRDEAHRFAITYHRKLRDDKSLASVLDVITGLGEKRKKALLKKFGTIEAIKSASVEALTELPSMNRVISERVLLQLKELTDEEE